MESNQNPNSIVEALKAAGEELKKASPVLNLDQRVGRPYSTERKVEETSGEVKTKEIDLLKKLEEYQKELSQEQSVLEKKHQEIQELEKKLARRIEFLKDLQTKSIQINKELKEFQEQLAIAKKENTNLLDSDKK